MDAAAVTAANAIGTAVRSGVQPPESDRARLRAAVARFPRGFYELHESGNPEVVRLAAAVHFFLALRFGPRFCDELAGMFSQPVRRSMGAFVEFAREQGLKGDIAGVTHVYPADVWEATKTGVEACRDFDRALDADVKADELLRVATSAADAPLPQVDVD